MERYICIHGHFYQPPRENPWLEAIELQDSAYPYHDWNARIAAECYAPNAAARILDGQGRIVSIVNNYSQISFNFGPTLLAWLEAQEPEAYQAILAADRESRARYSGHGSAIAQAYNHLIMPLSSLRDRATQVIWGIQDFAHRFGRQPEGMWLPETAVDLETLDLLAEHGIRFTILSPYQARRVRRIDDEAAGDDWPWIDVVDGRIDPSMPYAVRLPSGREIAIFFYDGPISQAVAFEGLLDRGEHLANRLMGAFSESRTHPQLAHIATDGESYGHHHRHGDMALAYALAYIERNDLARLTNYGEFLELYPPTHEVEIAENTSWSCFHGIERWRSDCGCNSGGLRRWSQAWRAPLRAALDWLRDAVAPRFEREGRALLRDPWAARDDYIAVVLDRSPESIDAFLERHAAGRGAAADQATVLKLMELQRHAMLMYTSCGWFFDEISGIETVQILQYAGRVIQLADELFDVDLLREFLDMLELAGSNIHSHRNGRRVYEQLVRPAVVDLPKVAAHYAMSSLFEEYADQTQVYCYRIERQAYQSCASGRMRLAVGRARVTSAITGESALLGFGVLHFGDHNLIGGVRATQDEKRYRALIKGVADAFDRADLSEVLRLLNQQFGQLSYSLKSLFRDEQRKILGPILEAPIAEAEASYRQIYERHTPLLRFLADLGMPLPRDFAVAAEFALGASLRQALAGDELDPPRIMAIIEDAQRVGITLNSNAGLGYTLAQTIERLIEQLRAHPSDLVCLQRLDAAIDLARSLPFQVNFWQPQNTYYELLRTTGPA